MTSTRESGFTLIETIVALTILAAVVGGFQLCLSTGWRGLRLANQDQLAIEAAHAQLAVIGHDAALFEGNAEGETGDGFQWRSTVSRYQADARESAFQNDVDGYWVAVKVSWQEGPRRRQRFVELTSFKIGKVK